MIILKDDRKETMRTTYDQAAAIKNRLNFQAIFIRHGVKLLLQRDERQVGEDIENRLSLED